MSAVSISKDSMVPMSMYEILESCNRTMMQSDVLGNTIAKTTDQAVTNMIPVYENMKKMGDVIAQMNDIEQYITIASYVLLPLSLAGGLFGALARGLSASASATIKAVTDGLAELTQAVVSTLQGIATTQSTQSQSSLSMDQAKVSTLSNQSKTLYGSIKGQASVNQTVAQGTADIIHSNAQAGVAYKARKAY
jgi:hypothetical protein